MSARTLIATLLLAAMPVEVGSALAQPAVKPYNMARSTQFDITSKINGRSYRIFIYMPATPPPLGGYPVLYVTDGNGLFPIVAGQAEINGLLGSKMLVVGIGYPTDDPMIPMQLRNIDLTPSQPGSDLPGRPDAKAEDYGGGEAFFRFLTEELRPAISATTSVNPQDQSLYGHSLGGLFTLHVLFNHPAAFRSFIASSPSIWWNSKDVLKGEAALSRMVGAGQVTPRILIEVGGLEETVKKPLPPGMTEAEAQAGTAQARMIGNARDLAARLSALKGAAGYAVQAQVFESETHLSTIAASLSRALTFAEQK